MAESDKVFAGSIPKFYDTLMVPLIFEAYAANMAELVAAGSTSSVLETAAGSGVVARALAPKLKPDARYVVTDLNQPMLDYAATRKGPIAASNGGRRTHSTCRSTMPLSMSFAASSA
jgi:ubiquinone/menaquinone biosynthesis C-methylase UbiE